MYSDDIRDFSFIKDTFLVSCMILSTRKTKSEIPGNDDIEEDRWLNSMLDFSRVIIVRDRGDLEENAAIIHYEGTDNYFISNIPYRRATHFLQSSCRQLRPNKNND